MRNCPLCRTPLRKDNDPLAASEGAGADGEEEAPSLSLLQRAILASTFASWNEDEALGTTRPSRAREEPRRPRNAWVPSRRICAARRGRRRCAYSEIERRRL